MIWAMALMTAMYGLPQADTCATARGCYIDEGDMLGGMYTVAPMPEPQDVPAISIPAKDGFTYGWMVEDCHRRGNRMSCKVSRKRWTCEDGRRILLQSTNGTYHCILFKN